jgi:glycosyltransferase involved in cell wall biosynthesis
MMHVPEEKIRVVYQSCDPIFWDEKLRHQPPAARYRLPANYILCVGTLEERKNQLTVINAMNLLPDELSLVVVGRPRGKYGRQVVESQNGRVRVLSGVDFKDFPSLYAHAVASVYLSRFEGFGIPILESMCCDCPVVTSNLSSMPEAGGDAALYADPDDTDTVASHLQRLFTDEAFRQERIAQGRLQRMKFAPDKIAADLQAVYEELVAGSR